MKLYIMRHCKRDINDCSFESPLLDTGHLDAIESCKKMKKNNINVIYSSPFLRAIQSGNYYSKKYDINMNIDYSLCEYVNKNNKEDLMYSINNYIIPNEWITRYNININNMLLNEFNYDETLEECILRIKNFLIYIHEKYKKTNNNILIITHMSIVNIILHLINNIELNIEKNHEMGSIIKIHLI